MCSTAPGVQQAEPENVPIEGSLETSHLLEQVTKIPGLILAYHLTVMAFTDRCAPWNRPLPSNREFVPQGTRSTQGNRELAFSSRANQPPIDTAARSLRFIRLRGLGFGNAPATTDTSVTHDGNQTIIPRCHQIFVVPPGG